MGSFNESDHPRAGDGTFAAKGPAAEETGVALASTSAEETRTEQAMVRLGALVAHHHPEAETVIVEPGGICVEDSRGRALALSKTCSVAVDRVTADLDRTDPDTWEYYAEGFTPEAQGFEYPEGIENGEDGTMLSARLPVMYLMAGRSDSSLKAPISGCESCHGSGTNCPHCVGAGVQPSWDPERRELPDSVSLYALPPREFRQAWADDAAVDYRRSASSGQQPTDMAHQPDRGASYRGELPAEADIREGVADRPLTLKQMVSPGTRTVTDTIVVESHPRGYRVLAG